jgi:hypothetical protein
MEYGKILYMIWMMGFPIVCVLSKRLLVPSWKDAKWSSIEQYSTLEILVWLIVGYNLWHL